MWHSRPRLCLCGTAALGCVRPQVEVPLTPSPFREQRGELATAPERAGVRGNCERLPPAKLWCRLSSLHFPPVGQIILVSCLPVFKKGSYSRKGHIQGRSKRGHKLFPRSKRGHKLFLQDFKKAVAVGTAVARRPPHRSRRAGLPHRALALDHDGQARLGIRLTDARRG
jgi:hypothetical protein